MQLTPLELFAGYLNDDEYIQLVQISVYGFEKVGIILVGPEKLA